MCDVWCVMLLLCAVCCLQSVNFFEHFFVYLNIWILSERLMWVLDRGFVTCKINLANTPSKTEQKITTIRELAWSARSAHLGRLTICQTVWQGKLLATSILQKSRQLEEVQKRLLHDWLLNMNLLIQQLKLALTLKMCRKLSSSLEYRNWCSPLRVPSKTVPIRQEHDRLRQLRQHSSEVSLFTLSSSLSRHSFKIDFLNWATCCER